ncbi:ribonuclease H-like domain-containing protein [Tanacetum coccineum]
MSFSKRLGNDAVCYTKPLDSLKSWNDRFFWVDAFACPCPASSQYNAEHYATLVAYPAPFHKYPEPFLCLIGISQMDLLSFIRTADPTKVRVGERQRAEGEPKLLDTTVGRVVPLLPVAPARASSELEASVDKLFDEGGSGGQTKQGDSAIGGHGVGILPVSETLEIVVKDAAPVQPKRQRKKKTIVSDVGEPSHPPKKLREDYETSTGPSVAGKSRVASRAQGDVEEILGPFLRFHFWDIRLPSVGESLPMVNYGVTCEDEAKRRNFGAKIKTFEENCYLPLYAVSSKEDTAYQRKLITRIRVMINSRSGVSLITYTPYAQLVISQRYAINVIDVRCGVSKLLLRTAYCFYSLNGVSVPKNDSAYSVNSIRRTAIQQTHTAWCMTWSSTKELLTPFENLERVLRSRRKLFETPSLPESNSPEFDQISEIEEHIEEEEGQFLKELHDNTFSGSEHEDENKHIEKVLEIVDLFHISNVTQDQSMLRAFPVSLTGAASHWLRSEPTGSITTWEQEPDESLFCAWERFKELLMKCHHHYLTGMQEVILFYNGLDVPTRQILDSRGSIPTKTVVDANVAIQEMVEYSQKWHNGTSLKNKSTETSDGLAAIQAQLNSLGREINKLNEKMYVAQVGCKLCKGPHYTKDCPHKEEGKTLEEAYYTQFGTPYQPGGQYRATRPGFYQRNNGNSSYPAILLKNLCPSLWQNQLRGMKRTRTSSKRFELLPMQQ